MRREMCGGTSARGRERAKHSPVTETPVADIDVTRPHTARMYDYYLGGKNHFAGRPGAGGEDAGQRAVTRGPRRARTARSWAGRSGSLPREAGVRQFLDIGTGLPTTDSVHEVAQAVAPSARVVYGDNDPLVLAHARALLTSAPEGRTAYIHTDLRRPRRRSCPTQRACATLLDFTQPIVLTLVAILHFIPDEDKPRRDHRHPARRPAPGQLPGRLARHPRARPGQVRRLPGRLQCIRRDGPRPRLGRFRPAGVLRPPARTARNGARIGMAARQPGTTPHLGRGRHLRRRRPPSITGLEPLRRDRRHGRRVTRPPATGRSGKAEIFRGSGASRRRRCRRTAVAASNGHPHVIEL